MAQEKHEIQDIESLILGIRSLAEGETQHSDLGVSITHQNGRYIFKARSKEQLHALTQLIDNQFSAAIGYLGTLAVSHTERRTVEPTLDSVSLDYYEDAEENRKKRAAYAGEASTLSNGIIQQGDEWVAISHDINPICDFYLTREAAQNAGVYIHADTRKFDDEAFLKDARQAVASQTVSPTEVGYAVNIMTNGERQIQSLREQMDKAMPVLSTTPLPGPFKSAIGVLHTTLTLADMVNQFKVSQRTEQAGFAKSYLSNHPVAEHNGNYSLDVSSLSKSDRKRLTAGLKALGEEGVKLSGDTITFAGKPRLQTQSQPAASPFDAPITTRPSPSSDAALIQTTGARVITPAETNLTSAATNETRAAGQLVDQPQPKKPIPPQKITVEKHGSGDQFSERCDHIARAFQQEAAGCHIRFDQTSGLRDITFKPDSEHARENFNTVFAVRGYPVPKPIVDMFALREPNGALRQDAAGNIVFPEGMKLLPAAGGGHTVRLPTQQFVALHSSAVDSYNAKQPDRSKHIDTSHLLGGIGGFLRDTNRILDRNTAKKGREGVEANHYQLNVEFLNERPLTQAARFDRLSRIQSGETDIKPVAAATFSNFLPSSGRAMDRVHEDLAPAIAGYKAHYTAFLGNINMTFKPNSNTAHYEGSEATHPIKTAMEDLGFHFGKGGCKLKIKQDKNGDITEIKVIAPYHQVEAVDAALNDIHKSWVGKLGNFLGDTLTAAPLAAGLAAAGTVAAGAIGAGAAAYTAATGTAAALSSTATTGGVLGGSAIPLFTHLATTASASVASTTLSAAAGGALATAANPLLVTASLGGLTSAVLSRFSTNRKHVASLHDLASMDDVIAIREQAILAEKILGKAPKARGADTDYTGLSDALNRAADRLEGALREGKAVSLSEFKHELNHDFGSVHKNFFSGQNVLDFGAGFAQAAIHTGGVDKTFLQHQKEYVGNHPSIINPTQLNRMHGNIKTAFETARVTTQPSADASFLASASKESGRATSASLIASATQAAAQATQQMYGV